MKAEQLAKLWQDGLKEAYGEGQSWDKLSEQQKQISIRVAVKVLERLACEKIAPTLDNSMVDSLFDQAKLAMTVARLADHVQRLETEVLSESVMQANPDRERQTLRGRVNELSKMAALGEVSNPWED